MPERRRLPRSEKMADCVARMQRELDLQTEGALKLERPLPDGAVKIVARGESRHEAA